MNEISLDLFIPEVDWSGIIIKSDDIVSFKPLITGGESAIAWLQFQHDKRRRDWERQEIPSGPKVDGKRDLSFLRGLDPVDWKDQDHYKVLGIQHLRHGATEDDIKRAYKVRVLRHHPDKRQAAGEQVNREGDYFACIVKAYEILSNPSKRRAYDSIEPQFDNYKPPKTVKSPNEFFNVYGKWFFLNSRWSEKQPAPLLGNMFSTRAQVDSFYQFWFDFPSWREYSYLDEEDKEKGGCKEERRWIEKENKAQRAKLKKEEMARLRSVVESAWNLDPRILLFKEKDKMEKAQKKLQRQKAFQEEKEKLEKVKLEEERKAKEEAELQEAEAKEKENALKKEREAQKKAVKKERKIFRTLCKANDYYVVANTSEDEKAKVKHMAVMEELCETLGAEELARINRTLQNLSLEEGNLEFQRIMEALVETKAKNAQTEVSKSRTDLTEEGKSTVGNSKNLHQWSHTELQLLIKAVNLFPAGTNQRWQVVANFISQHSQGKEIGNGDAGGEGRKRSAKEVMAKAKDLSSSNFSKNCLKEEVNQNAYQVFEKNKKQSLNVKNTNQTTAESNTKETTETKSELNGEQVAVRKNNSSECDLSLGNSSTGLGSSTTPAAWTADEQKLLEQALKTYPASFGEGRWNKISESVPGRSKKECIARCKELAALVKSKKSAQML